MGLDARVGKNGKMIRLGSYGWYHSFRHFISRKLENKIWGSKYPLLQNHSDCEGEYSIRESKELLNEILHIELELSSLEYPIMRIFDKNGNLIEISEMYGEEPTFKPNDTISHHHSCFGNQTYGYGIGVCEKGIIVIRRNKVLGFFEEIFETKGRTKDNDWVNFPIEETHSIFGVYPNAYKITFSHKPASEIFSRLIEKLRSLCEDSINFKKPIIYC